MRWKSVLIKSIPAIIGLCILLVLNIVLSGSKYYSELTRYGYPICSIDRHRFESDTCEACGKSVENSGVFYSISVVMEDPYSEDYSLRFKDYYESWDAFKSDYTFCFALTLVVLAVLIIEVGLYLFLFMWSRKLRRQKERRLRREGK